MEQWRLLDLEHREPHQDLATEEAIARTVGRGKAPNTVRFWRADKSVVIGRFQDEALEVNPEAVQRHRVVVVRRFTGGGAVYHDLGNLNWAVSVQRVHPVIPSPGLNVARVFKTLSAGVIAGLRRLGLDAEFAPVSDIRINGGKVSGTAGVLKWGVAFFHGTLLVSSNLQVIEEVLDAPEADVRDRKVVRSVRKRMTTIEAELKRSVSIPEVKRSLVRGFESVLGVQLLEGDITVEEERLSDEIRKDRYPAGKIRPAPLAPYGRFLLNRPSGLA
jgi:lipoate---protein ligase